MAGFSFEGFAGLRMAPQPILNTVKRFIKAARQYGIPVEAGYLFGSWTQGRGTEGSDIDLAIISSAFKGVKFSDRRKLDNVLLEVDTDIHIHPYRPQDFDESNPFVREILNTGIRIV